MKVFGFFKRHKSIKSETSSCGTVAQDDCAPIIDKAEEEAIQAPVQEDECAESPEQLPQKTSSSDPSISNRDSIDIDKIEEAATPDSTPEGDGAKSTEPSQNKTISPDSSTQDEISIMVDKTEEGVSSNPEQEDNGDGPSVKLKQEENPVEKNQRPRKTSKSRKTRSTKIPPEDNDFKSLEETANKGYADAQYIVGMAYLLGEGVQQSVERGIYWIERSAYNDYAKSQAMFGDIYFEGVYTERDFYEAFEWYFKASEQGDAHSEYRMAWCFENGRGIFLSYRKAELYYRLSAEHGDPDGQFGLARFLLTKSLNPNPEEAVQLLTKSAGNGNIEAMRTLGNCYLSGTGTEQSLDKAIEYYEMASIGGDEMAAKRLNAIKSAIAGNAEEQFELGGFFSKLKEPGITEGSALYWYERAALNDHVQSQIKLGDYYGKTKDDEGWRTSLQWFQMAAKQLDEYAQYIVVRMSECSDPGPESLAMAIEQYPEYVKKSRSKAVSKRMEVIGSRTRSTDAFYCMAIERIESIGHPDEESFGLLLKSAEHGNADAQFEVGRCYESGSGTTQSNIEALRWYEKAARKGNSNAQLYAARLLIEGEGMGHDYDKAVDLLWMASDQGNEYAQYRLANCYLNGIGVSQSTEDAGCWFKTAGDALFRKAEQIREYDPEAPEIKRYYLDAVKCYRRGADCKNPYALMKLAMMYENGFGVRVNRKSAMQCYEEANRILSDNDLDEFGKRR